VALQHQGKETLAVQATQILTQVVVEAAQVLVLEALVKVLLV
jgi:hypothetical protein